MCRELELIKCKNVVAVGGGCVRILQEYEDGHMRRGGLLDLPGSGGCLPMCGGCVGGNVGFCVRLRAVGGRGGEGEWSSACAAEW